MDWPYWIHWVDSTRLDLTVRVTKNYLEEDEVTKAGKTWNEVEKLNTWQEPLDRSTIATEGATGTDDEYNVAIKCDCIKVLQVKYITVEFLVLSVSLPPSLPLSLSLIHTQNCKKVVSSQTSLTGIFLYSFSTTSILYGQNFTLHNVVQWRCNVTIFVYDYLKIECG